MRKYICQSNWCSKFNKEISEFEIYITRNHLVNDRMLARGLFPLNRMITCCLKCGQEVMEVKDE